jgi:hypothetical protein
VAPPLLLREAPHLLPEIRPRRRDRLLLGARLREVSIGGAKNGAADPGERATARRRASISRLRATFSPSSSATRDAAAASGLPRRHVTLRARSGDPPDDGLRFGGRSGTRRRGECGAPVRCEVRRKKDAASCTGLPAPGGDRKGRAGDAACGDACACAPCCGDACCRDPKKFDMAAGRAVALLGCDELAGLSKERAPTDGDPIG